MIYNRYLIVYFFFFLFSTLLGLDVVRNNNNISSFSISASSASSAGALPDIIDNNTITFSHLYKFSGLYGFNAMDLKYNQIRYSILYNEVSNIHDTSQMWEDNGNGIPELGEIDYNKISYFDFQNLSLLVSKRIKHNIKATLRLSNSQLYINKSFGLGFNLGYENIFLRKINYGLMIYDLFSFTQWNTGRLEVLLPLWQIHLNTKIKNLSLGLNILFDDIGLEYKIGSGLDISDNFRISIGNNSIYKLTCGFTIRNEAIGFSYAYMIPNENLPFDNSQQFSILINIDAFIKKQIVLRP